MIGQPVTEIVSSPDGSALFLPQMGTISVVPLTGEVGMRLPPEGVIGLLGASPDGQQPAVPDQGRRYVRASAASGSRRRGRLATFTVCRPRTTPRSRTRRSPRTASGRSGSPTTTSTAPAKLMAGAGFGRRRVAAGTGARNVSAAVGARIIYTDAYTVAPGGRPSRPSGRRSVGPRGRDHAAGHRRRSDLLPDARARSGGVLVRRRNGASRHLRRAGAALTFRRSQRSNL